MIIQRVTDGLNETRVSTFQRSRLTLKSDDHIRYICKKSTLHVRVSRTTWKSKNSRPGLLQQSSHVARARVRMRNMPFQSHRQTDILP